MQKMKTAVIRSIELIGSSTISFFRYIGGITLLFLDSLLWIFKGAALQIRLIVQQAAILGVNSTAIVLITTGFTGAVISLQLAYLAAKYGAGRFVGFGVAIAMARELAPMITAVTVAGRTGSAITAEIGSMKVTEQIDALEALATSPVRYLVVPRLMACATMIPMLCMFAMLSGVIGGALVAYLIADIQFKVYFDSIRDFMLTKDIYKGILKSFIFAIEMVMIACYQGLTTEGGAAGVGKSTTGSVVYSILIVFITNFFLTAILFPTKGSGLW